MWRKIRISGCRSSETQSLLVTILATWERVLEEMAVSSLVSAGEFLMDMRSFL